VDEERVLLASCESKNQHQSIVQAKASHVVIAVKGAMAVAEVFVALQQTAVVALCVSDNILVSAISQLIDNGITIASVKCTDSLSFLFAYRL
jgi:succinyl-CoA synthetase alpha subunit